MMNAMATNQADLAINRTNPFHYQKLNLSQIVFYRNGQLRRVLGSPFKVYYPGCLMIASRIKVILGLT